MIILGVNLIIFISKRIEKSYIYRVWRSNDVYSHNVLQSIIDTVLNSLLNFDMCMMICSTTTSTTTITTTITTIQKIKLFSILVCMCYVIIILFVRGPRSLDVQVKELINDLCNQNYGYIHSYGRYSGLLNFILQTFGKKLLYKCSTYIDELR